MNNEIYTVSLSRIDICNLMTACTHIVHDFPAGSDGAKKWVRIHDELKAQLEEADRKMTEVF